MGESITYWKSNPISDKAYTGGRKGRFAAYAVDRIKCGKADRNGHSHRMGGTVFLPEHIKCNTGSVSDA